jgi:exopolysaccharide production protein ExoZ
MKKKNLHGIQAVRGVFAVLVVCHHVGVHSMRYWQHNWLGGVFNQSTFRVDFFFVLSGFALWTAHHADVGMSGGWRAFLAKRLWRLYPLLIVLTLVKALILWLVPGRSLESYYLLPSLLALPQDAFPIIVAAWTLSFEVVFTALLTICLTLPRRAALPTLMAWGLLVSCASFLLGIRPGLHGVAFLTHPFVLEFVAGVLVAEGVRRCSGLGGSRPWGILLCGLSFVGLVIGATRHSWVTSHPVIWQKSFWAIVFAMGLGGLALWERTVGAAHWRLRDVFGLGRASYSIFLSHGFVLMAAFALVRPGMLPSHGIWLDVSLVLVVVLSVLFGQAVWYWLERPLSRLGRSAEGRPAPAVRGSASQQLS